MTVAPDLTVAARPRSPLRKAVLTVAGGTAAAQLLGGLIAPLLTRFYSPTELGAQAACLSLLSVLLVVGCLRYDLAISVARDESAALRLFCVASLVLLGFAGVAAGVAWVLAPWFTATVASLSVAGFVVLLVLGLLGGGISQAGASLAARRQDYSAIAGARVRSALTKAVVQVAGGIAGGGATALFAGTAAAQLSSGGRLARVPVAAAVAEGRRAGWRGLAHTAREHWPYAAISTPGALTNAVGLQAPTFMILAIYGNQVLGWFALAQLVVGVPMGLLGQSVAQVYVGEAGRLVETDRPMLHRLFRRTVLHLCAIAVPPFLALAIAGPTLFGWAFGAEWVSAGTYIRLLSIGLAAQFIVSPLAQTLTLLGRQGQQLAWEIGRLLLTVAPFLVAHRLELSPATAIAAYSCAAAAAYAGLLTLSIQAMPGCMR